MKIFLTRRGIFEFLLCILLLLPIISFLSYTFLGVFFNFNNFNFLIYFSIILLAISYIRKLNRAHFMFFVVFFIILISSLFIYIRNGGFEGIFEFLRTVSGYYIFVFIGWCLYKIYYEKGETLRLLRLVVRMALWISIVNIFHFVLLHTDNYIHAGWTITFDRYSIVTDYLMELNKLFYDYIVISAQYNDVGFIRHVGYFFDTHSQYYLPLAASIILVFQDKLSRYKTLYLSILLLSVLLSGIKTAYMTIILMFIVSLIGSGRMWLYIKRSIPVILIVSLLFRDKISHLIFGDGMWKILFQLFSHFVVLPFMFLKTDMLSFFLGGAPYLRDDPAFYSEVFWVSVTFYIGVVGLIIYFKPMKLLKYLSDDHLKIGAYIYILFCLSLVHYSVYMVGINNLVSAIPFMYYFSINSVGKPVKYQI